MHNKWSNLPNLFIYSVIYCVRNYYAWIWPSWKLVGECDLLFSFWFGERIIFLLLFLDDDSRSGNLFLQFWFACYCLISKFANQKSQIVAENDLFYDFWFFFQERYQTKKEEFLFGVHPFWKTHFKNPQIPQQSKNFQNLN